MDYRTVAMISLAIIAGMVAASALGFTALPDSAMVPIHFGLDGRADAWAHPLVGLSLLPAAAIAVVVVFILLAHNAQGGLARSGTAFRTTLLGVISLLGATHGIIIASAMGQDVNGTRIVVLFIGLAMLAIGNVMGKVRPNRWLGIRTPWTLRDDRVWDGTHRFAGWIYVGAGATLAIAALIVPAATVLGTILLSTIAIVVIVPYAQSYLLWRNRQHI